MIAAKYGKKKQLYIGNKILASELNSKKIKKKKIERTILDPILSVFINSWFH